MPVNSPALTLVDSGDVFVHGHTDSTAAATVTTGEDLRTLVNPAGTVWITKPRLTREIGPGAFKRGLGHGNELLRSKKRVNLRISRPTSATNANTIAVPTGSFAVYGVDLPDPLSGKPLGNAFATEQDETCSVFKATATTNSATSTYDASALGTAAIDADSKGYNWLVVVNGVIIPWAGAKMDNILSWSIAAGVVTIYGSNAGAGTLAAGDDIVVYKLATADVTELLAAGIHDAEDVTIQSKDVIWTYWTTNQLASTKTIARIHPMVGA
jgi:hypothetical protein